MLRWLFHSKFSRPWLCCLCIPKAQHSAALLISCWSPHRWPSPLTLLYHLKLPYPLTIHLRSFLQGGMLYLIRPILITPYWQLYINSPLKSEQHMIVGGLSECIPPCYSGQSWLPCNTIRTWTELNFTLLHATWYPRGPCLDSLNAKAPRVSTLILLLCFWGFVAYLSVCSY